MMCSDMGMKVNKEEFFFLKSASQLVCTCSHFYTHSISKTKRKVAFPSLRSLSFNDGLSYGPRKPGGWGNETEGP